MSLTHTQDAIWKRAEGGETEDEDRVCYYRPHGHVKEFGLYSNKERSLEGFKHVSDVI